VIKPLGWILLGALLATGCKAGWPWRRSAAPPPAGPTAEPLPVQQARAYPETVTGNFVSLCDFEDSSTGARGHDQVRWFARSGLRSRGYHAFVVNVTRTGVGAMEVMLPPGVSLVLTLPHVHDFSSYTLLSMALHSRTIRDDLRVTLRTRTAAWTSHPTILHRGWNNVLIDIQSLRRLARFDPKGVRTIEIHFTDAERPVTFNLDDVMLIHNHRRIEPAPAGITLTKFGLDYALGLPGREKPLLIRQSTDGLWRLGNDQAIIALAGKGLPADGWEDLEIMGTRRVGRVHVLEHNAARLRIVNIWYFPTRAGEWASLGIRQVRWDYTFFADGRAVTSVEVNNAGGEQIRSVRIALPAPAAWSEGGIGRELLVRAFAGPVARWSYLTAAAGARRKDYLEAFRIPGRIRSTLGRRAFAAGDLDRDGFDESQGCFYARATEAGHCRFTVLPLPNIPLVRPVFRVAGPWKPAGTVRASALGLPIRNVVRTDAHHVLFVLPETVTYPVHIEVTGTP